MDIQTDTETDTEDQTETESVPDYPIHPLASLFPPMTDDEFNALKDSIKTDGFDTSKPITVHQELLDEIEKLRERDTPQQRKTIFGHYHSGVESSGDNHCEFHNAHNHGTSHGRKKGR